MNRYVDMKNDRAFGGDAYEQLVLVCTRAGRVIYQSASLSLYLEEELTGRNLNDFIADKLAASIIGNAQQGQPFTFEAMVCARLFACRSEPGGENIHIALEPLTDSDATFINSFSAGFISREINLSLSLMFSAISALESEQLSHAGQMGAATLRQNMYRLLRLSRNMLDCSQATNGDMKLHLAELDLAALCRKLGDRLAPIMEQLKVRFTLTVPDRPVLCTADGDKVERMIYNLISNAIIALGDRREITLTLAEKENNVAITVIDRGRGIERGLLPHAMKKHIQMNPESPSGWSGAGFGIALVDALAKRQGGTFVITTQHDQGTLACITLPRRRSNRDSMPLGSLYPDYAGGLDRALIELSSAIGKEFYM